MCDYSKRKVKPIDSVVKEKEEDFFRRKKYSPLDNTDGTKAG
jgi:hypothetical protein